MFIGILTAIHELLGKKLNIHLTYLGSQLINEMSLTVSLR